MLTHSQLGAKPTSINSIDDILQFTISKEAGWNQSDSPGNPPTCIKARGYLGIRECDNEAFQSSCYPHPNSYTSASQLYEELDKEKLGHGNYSTNEFLNEYFQCVMEKKYYEKWIQEISDIGVAAHLYDYNYWKPAQARDCLNRLGGVSTINTRISNGERQTIIKQIQEHRNNYINNGNYKDNIIKSYKNRMEELAALTGGSFTFKYKDSSKDNGHGTDTQQQSAIRQRIDPPWGNWFLDHCPR
jgi:hypothetical protein